MKLNKKFPVDTLLFLVDTSEFDNKTLGIYTRLLFTQWENRDLPKDLKSLASISKCTEKEFKEAWPLIKHKFVDKGNGRIYNLRVQETREAQEKTSYGKSVAGQTGAETRKARGKELKNIVYPWDTVTFKEKWELWKKYKKETFRFNYKTAVSEQAALNALTKIAANESQALELMHHAMSMQWQGIYLPTNFKFNDGTQTGDKNRQQKGDFNPNALNAINDALKKRKRET